MDENLNFYEPSESQLAKFQRINATPNEICEVECASCNDCSVCTMAVHTFLLSTTKHTCTRGISETKFRSLMSSADCEY